MPSYFPPATASTFVPAPSGTHRAVCYRFIDLGTQQSEYQGQTSHKRQIMLGWELSDELMDDGKPFTVAKFYTFSMNEKANLRHDLEAWRGVPFTDADLGPEGKFKPQKLLGAPCLLGVIHAKKNNGDTKVKVSSLARLPKSMAAPAPVNPTMFFDLDAFDPVMFATLTEGVQAMIRRSPEYAEATKQAPAPQLGKAAPLDDEVPF